MRTVPGCVCAGCVFALINGCPIPLCMVCNETLFTSCHSGAKHGRVSMEATSRLPLIMSSVVSLVSAISGCFNETNITTPARNTPLEVIKG